MPKIAQVAPTLIGKTIAHVVLKAGEAPASQLFLLFTDGTYYEVFGGPIHGAGGLDRGTLEDVCRYLSPPQEVVFAI